MRRRDHSWTATTRRVLPFVVMCLLPNVCQAQRMLERNGEKVIVLINKLRERHKLPAIPVSKKLTKVAVAHVTDKLKNPAWYRGKNAHSWSPRKGKDGKEMWTSGVFDLEKASSHPIMWSKPKEIAGYEHDGYEISAWGTRRLSPQQALDLWVKSKPHLDVILNRGIWEKYEWKGIGAALGGGRSDVWFGAYADEEEEPQ